MTRFSYLADTVEHFRKRVLQDALNEATAAYWRKRALDFDRVGTPECDEIAQVCRNRARVSLLGGDVEEFYSTVEILDGESA